MGYKAGMTHVVRDLDRPGSKMHKKEVIEAVTITEKPPLIVIASHLSDEVKRHRFYKNWYCSKKHAEDSSKSVACELERIRKYSTVVRVLAHTQSRNTGRAGQNGYHHRTELNKKICRIGSATDDANASTNSDVIKKLTTPMGGFPNYGMVKNVFLILKGSIPGTKNRVITIRKSLIVYTSRRDLEKVQLKFIDTSSKFAQRLPDL
ncbi:translation protein [Mycena rebaudengoi]|nr:translation protein [Mycena rebaudengoi]